ncbi:MAG: hypothetical protein A3B99_04715 [Candidatus Yanofskybacteria bacterium RIFCSPHIGHO2_02_FULL_44_12b]|uniref:GtrA/DPMS transmembrane domain-containing protein n=2 Tax=Candidatus Yanofskyibacteriota TaxID=1752733 RepID=A0A1F8GMU4_9BACT|nr:MAG: hypothetical protein UW79_C0003G0011 [Candidatus Yanofskybacteria bacterium GW2011_GWA2_44_9]OGN04369.1 MAG: hypothetical protein A2659_03515 [Candidatus Yanofskybacteria bacterium RIFCSPHIGHO2_01_FULL_44_24]OGN14478.1 MAG: hypothetical protein A3B99_04715 [Candidatus Yanofskybacteria bacterium RIFCSPHIGHO2_02_FULL_44_12b]OGN25759.1 MAG: hypothetical protein A2925_01055 [Candidatus Yanofskybacteria bacterium RIFCSPLOWO2_01_FULL_44_22]
MNKFTKKDLFSAIFSGFYTGFIAWKILDFLKLNPFLMAGNFLSVSVDLPNELFMLIVPVVWILGVNLGYFLGRWMGFFNQFGRFAAIGFTNFAVYAGTLNLLIAFSDIASGVWYSVFVGTAFTLAAFHSYFWNKYWVFDSGTSAHAGTEFAKFIAVSVMSGLVNVGVASLLVNVVGPLFGTSAQAWANVGGVAGSAVALVFSFIGFRIVVFKGSSQKLAQQ